MGPSPLPESRILKPRDKSIVDSNQWPDFPLVQVDVRDAQTGKAANLLFADAGSPVTVVGRLDPLSLERSQYLRDNASLPATIEITNVELFSYGQYEEGEVALWAAGEAGWYEIKPARSYRAIFREMVEAVNLLYFAADFYRGLDRYKVRKTLAEDVYQQYAAEPSHKCRNTEDALKVFHKHKQFLVISMENGKEGIAWKQTKLYQDLLRESPETEASEAVTPMEIVQDSTPPRRPPHAGKGKSILRPRSEKHSMKGAGRRQSPAPAEEMERDEDGKGKPTVSGSEHRNGKASSPSVRKRKNGHKHQSRRGRPQHKPNLENSDASDPSLPEESDETQPDERPLPLVSNGRPPTSKPSSIIRIIESPLPSYEPQGPGDTWMCNFDGCTHRVYGASAFESRELIKEHYRGHALSTQAQIDLVYKEERPYLPVGNLIKKIREMAAQQTGTMPTEAGAEAMRGWPKPMERRF